MSIENHPNINAAGFTSDLITSFHKHIRGKADLDNTNRQIAAMVLQDEIIDFVTKISEKLDEKFGI